MKTKITFGNPLKITTFSPFPSTAPEYSTIKTPAGNTMLKQWLKGKIGVSFPSIIVHSSDCLVQLKYITCDIHKITGDNFSGLTLVGDAA